MLLQLVKDSIEKEKEFTNAFLKVLNFDSGYVYYNNLSAETHLNIISAIQQPSYREPCDILIFTDNPNHTVEELSELCDMQYFHLFYHENPKDALSKFLNNDKVVELNVVYSFMDLYRIFASFGNSISKYETVEEWFEREQHFDKSKYYDANWLLYCLENYNHLIEE